MDNVQQLSVIIHAEERCAVINTYIPGVVLRLYERSVGLKVALSCVNCIKRPGVTIVQSLQWLSYGLDDRGIGVWFATGLKFFFPPQQPQPPDLLWGHTVLCYVSTWGPSSRGKADCDCSSLSVTQVRNVWSCISTRPYVFLAECLINLLKPNDTHTHTHTHTYIYMSYRSANLQTLHFKYLFNNIHTEYFKHAA